MGFEISKDVSALGMLNVMAAGAKLDGVTDDAPAINQALQAHNVVYVPPGHTFVLRSTVVIPDGKALVSFGKGSTAKLETQNIAAFELGNQSLLDTFTVNLPPNNTSDEAGAIRVRLTAASTRAHANNIEIHGVDSTANGIVVIENSNPNAYMIFSIFENLFMQRVKNGVYFNVTTPAYSNGNIFNNFVIYSSVRLCHIEGDSNANIFTNLQWNQGPLSREAIYATSNFNQFHGWFYDLHDGIVPNTVALFEGDAMDNRIMSAGDEQWIIDDRTPLKLNSINISYHETREQIMSYSYLPNIWMSSSNWNEWGYWYRYKPYGGIQDNILAYADKIHKLTITPEGQEFVQGDWTLVAKNYNTDFGNISNIFDPFAYLSTAKPEWELRTDSVNKRMDCGQFEIEFLDTNPNRRLDFVQIVFATTYEAKRVIIEIWDGAQWVVAAEEDNNAKRFVTYHGTVDGICTGANNGNPTKVRFTVADPINADANGNGIIRVEMVNGRFLSAPGNTFMPRTGGKVYGQLDMNNNFLTLGKKTALPPPDAAYRGAIVRIEGGPGVSDAVYVCVKRANDYYVWLPLIQ